MKHAVGFISSLFSVYWLRTDVGLMHE
uniref:Biopterin-dependent aromatic amino acid hydroxylase family profile domain-containing protein n=1 Tax=Rhizophora mucronata TaxID=61149 RepID=A0A2P2IS11_RHIMU